MGTGLPNVVIDDMVLHGGARIARVFTHGRSVWEINLDQLVNSAPVSRSGIPATFALEQNYPNPFNPATTIGFSLARQEEVRLAVYDLQGRSVRTLAHAILAAGSHSIVWNGRDDLGITVSSGMYICRLLTSSSGQSRKMILVR
jgi:hypothetical protein